MPTTQDKAKEVLLHNLYEVELNHILYRRTVPSREFYIHQWNWDSATHAMGLVHIDPSRAYDEIISLISGQWDNGLIAQITFNPNESKYFPGPQFWNTQQFSQGEISTSGITQPPLLGFSIWYVYQNSPNKKAATEFLSKTLPALKKYHHYLKTFRDPEDSGLLTVVHPWESGLDNSPRWDDPLKNISLDSIPDSVKILVNTYRSDNKIGNNTHRPGLEDYYRYMYLVYLFSEWKWDYSKIVTDSPFAVKDILFNSLWALSNEALSSLCSTVSESEDAAYFLKLANQTSLAIQKQWSDSESLFQDVDVSLGQHKAITSNTISTFSPLMTSGVTLEIIKSLHTRLNDPSQYATPYPLPTTSLNNPVFETKRYWRGPTWPITNLFTILGLHRYRQNQKCLQLRDNLINNTKQMIDSSGFFEYFDPTLGLARPNNQNAAYGFGSFSWTAAIYTILSQPNFTKLKLPLET
ncbi:hypothetical protein HYV64_04800 [Candidatus Shapirobacteria bacterium]|nr:hypothetical protein [Candidatus Shapirobacteria bacterium]